MSVVFLFLLGDMKEGVILKDTGCWFWWWVFLTLLDHTLLLLSPLHRWFSLPMFCRLKWSIINYLEIDEPAATKEQPAAFSPYSSVHHFHHYSHEDWMDPSNYPPHGNNTAINSALSQLDYILMLLNILLNLYTYTRYSSFLRNIDRL